MAQQPALVFDANRAQHPGDRGHHLGTEGLGCPPVGIPQFSGILGLAPYYIHLIDLLAFGVEAVPRQLAMYVQAYDDGHREGRSQPTHVDRSVQPIAAQIAPSDDQVIAQHGQCLPLGQYLMLGTGP